MTPSLWQRLTRHKGEPAWREALNAAYTASDEHRYEEALQHLERALAAASEADRVHVLTGLPDGQLEGFAKVAVSAAEYTEFEIAEKILERAVALSKETIPLADAWARLAENAAFATQWERARAYLDRAMASHPGRIMPHHLDLPDRRAGQ